MRTRKHVPQTSSTNDTETVIDTVEVEAWYTPEIPVSHGPDNYWGLPGLILELADGKVIYLRIRVVLKPEDEVDIKKPNRGKKINREKYQSREEERIRQEFRRWQLVKTH